jgi:PAS domain S-box-containing protein
MEEYRELRYLRVNDRLPEFIGKPRDEILGRTLHEVVPDIAPTVVPVYRRVIETGEPVLDLELSGKTAANPGVERHWLVSYAPLKSADGEVVAVSSIVQDVTEREEALQAVRLSEERLRAYMDHSPSHIYMKDAELRHLFANRALLDVFGLSLDEFARTSTSNFFSPEVTEMVEAGDRKVLEGSSRVEVTDLHTEVDGEERWWHDVKFPITDASGGLIVGGIATDITHLKAVETELRQALADNERLRELLEAENLYLREQVELQHVHGEIVAQSDAIKGALREAEQVAPTDSTVLLLGETGTGKELLAHAIHRMSGRSANPLVTVNCAALPSTLIESELFGREKGAYTGALSRQVGRFEIAHGSTIFLDEIGDLPQELQVKLLRVLQEGHFERLGSSNTITVDVRVIAATNRDLPQAVKEGRFREDLYYRLNVFPITVPRLRDRRDDIPPLVWSFVQEFAAAQGKTIDTVPRRTMEALQGYPWPGNVRELRNVIERAVILSDGQTLNATVPGAAKTPVAAGLSMDEVQRSHILQVMEQTGWRVRGVGGAAELLGMKPTTLENRMKKLGIEKPARR